MTKGYLYHHTGTGKQVLKGQEEQADKTSVKNRIEYKAITPNHSLVNVMYLSHYSCWIRSVANGGIVIIIVTIESWGDMV
jgi:hypothetical protein